MHNSSLKFLTSIRISLWTDMQIVYAQTGLSTCQISLDINNLKTGIYIVNVKMNDGSRVNCKMVKSPLE